MQTERAKEIGWVGTNEHASDLKKLNERDICSDGDFADIVSFQFADMNAIPDSFRGFDFCWACAFEHLGSIAHGLCFVERSLETLRPGGLAVHTTELNCSSEWETIDHEGTVLFRRSDFLDLCDRVRLADRSVKTNFNLGLRQQDQHIDLPPYPVDHDL